MSGFWSNIFSRNPKKESTLDLLETIPVFEELNSRELQAVERILYRRTFSPGEIIFRQGDPGVGMYILGEGEVEIRSEPDQTVLTILGVGSFFGEVSLLNEVPRSATAAASTECVLWGFFRPELMDLIERWPKLGVKILLHLAQIAGKRLVAVDVELRDMRTRDSEGR
ncbi:MAG: cyclic nucleotide-binding domain-containing protein [Bacteroidetes bacterium]|nr:cyclic nucleotide-binding domain-containing protein [Bacteroidota bacterium]